MNFQTVGVIGAGVIGSSVAQALAQAGQRVILLDVLDAVLERAQESIRQNVRLYRFYQKGVQVPAPEVVLERITFSSDYELLSETPFVIENVTESWEIKKEVYARIDQICAGEAIFAPNTSCIPITRLAAQTTRPAQVIGLHFMNPVPIMPAVEVIRGYHTSDETIQKATALLTAMGKQSILVNDAPGFVSNRVMTFAINEAVFLVYEGVALARDIDRIFKTCYGHKMGPLETADLIGLDTILFSMEALYENFNDSKFRPCPLLKKMVDAGLLGRKSGQGFYTYQDKA